MNADFEAHREKMERVLRDVLYSTHCHGCGRQGIPVALIGYGMGMYCMKRPCWRWGSDCPFGDECETCHEHDRSPSLAWSNYHNVIHDYGSRTTWPMTGKESGNACIAERNPVYIPWERGPDTDVYKLRPSPHNDWFLSKGY